MFRCKGTNAETLKGQKKKKKRRGSGNREKISLRRINLECNTYVHGSNARNLPVQLSLSQLAKMLCPSYYCLYSVFKKIRDKGRTVSAWK
jgi:hypothetical protein